MKLLSYLSSLLAGLSLLAQVQVDVTTLTANTAANIIAQGAAVQNLTATATTTNLTTIKFYDSSTTGTNIVQAAYTSTISYATNYSSVFTNESGVLVTNTFDGWYTGPLAVSASTNAKTAVFTLIVNGSSQRIRDVNLQLVRGLTAVANYGAILETSYKTR